MTLWLLAEDFAREFSAKLRAVVVTPEARAAFADRVEKQEATRAQDDGKPRNLTIAGDVAQIAIEGVLTQQRDFWAWLCDIPNTTYPDIIAALAIAEADPAVKRVQYLVCSPGGTIDGLFDTLDAVTKTTKPRAVLTSFAASAAYGIAAVAGKITATNAAVQIGSIGVACSFYVDEHLIDIASSNAPNKRPDVTTPEGQSVIRDELDALAELFVEAIGHGRGTTAEDVNTNFGRGGVFVAGEAKRRGMIDAIQRPALRALSRARAETDSAPEAQAIGAETAAAAAAATATQNTAEGGSNMKGQAMTSAELKLQHPDTYAAIVQEGVTAERTRAVAHLTKGEAVGALDIAVKAVREGTEMNAAIDAEYWAVGMKKQAAAARQADSDAAGQATEGLKPIATTRDLGDEVAAILTGKPSAQ